MSTSSSRSPAPGCATSTAAPAACRPRRPSTTRRSTTASARPRAGSPTPRAAWPASASPSPNRPAAAGLCSRSWCSPPARWWSGPPRAAPRPRRVASPRAPRAASPHQPRALPPRRAARAPHPDLWNRRRPRRPTNRHRTSTARLAPPKRKEFRDADPQGQAHRVAQAARRSRPRRPGRAGTARPGRPRPARRPALQARHRPQRGARQTRALKRYAAGWAAMAPPHRRHPTQRTTTTEEDPVPTLEDIKTWRGRDVVDSDGEKIGTLEDVYLDRASGEPEWAAIKTGRFGTKVSFAPLRDASDSLVATVAVVTSPISPSRSG